MSKGLREHDGAEPTPEGIGANVRPAKRTKGKLPMAGDRVIGDGGNVTVYERPDGTQYALDKKGVGREWRGEAPIFGRARFDSRAEASGTWEGSRSVPQVGAAEAEPANRARRRGNRFRTG